MQLASRLEELRANHLGVFRQLLGQPMAGLTDTDFVEAQLQSLAEALGAWRELLLTELHASARAGDGSDVLSLFFTTSVNASNYDALIVEQLMKGATTTFDDAMRVASDAFPSLTRAHLRELDWNWTRPLVLASSAWKEMHQARFNDVFRSWPSHQHVDSLTSAFAELCRAHFQTEGLLAVRNYRRTLLAEVTHGFAGNAPALSQAVAVLADTDVVRIREAAFSGFPLPEALAQAPDVANAYMLAWFDVVRVETDTIESAVADGRQRYAEEIQAVDCEDQFVRLGRQFVEASFLPVYDEVRSFYVSRLGGMDADSREGTAGGRV